MSEPEADDTSSKPSRQKVQPPDTQEERIVSTVYLAGEAVADVTPEPANHAVPEDDRDAPFFDDFDFVKETITTLRQAVARNPPVAEFLHRLPQGLGNGEILQVLFGNLFPEQRKRRKVYHDRKGKRILTDKQVEVLLDTARGQSPTQIAAKRGCAGTNIYNILKSIENRLHTGSPQASVAVAISMGYLPMDVMGFVMEAGQFAPKDYSAIDSMVSRLTEIEKVADPIYWQELAAFGLMLMLVSGAAIAPQTCAAVKLPTNGVLIRLDRQPDGTYRMRQIVGPGQIRYPSGIAIVPPAGRREGFTPGNVLVVHCRATLAGRNFKEIMEFTPDGQFVRAFCGARAQKTSLRGTHGITFAPSGALLATTDNALLRFTKGGSRVQWLVDGCCTDVCADRQGNLLVAHYSSRGGCLRSYTPAGKLKQEFANQPNGSNLCGVRVTGSGNIVALREQAQKSTLEVYSAEGEYQKGRKVDVGSWWPFALDVRENLLFLPNRLTQSLQVCSPDGTLQQRIELGAITPVATSLGSDGSLWVSGVVANPPSQ